ncbi:hypothetical protein ACIA8O_02950 [Kitasatospora sp. NPDC051853]|uniref:hypothetical protein n=1 Tax=Kitasatospora sp. NPDC051853 TaxID=3364058 RepID=UPI0037AE659D
MLPALHSTSPPRTTPDREAALRLLDAMVRQAGARSDLADPAAAAARSLATVERAFGLYEGRIAPDLPADRAFVVPSPISRQDPTRGPEIHHLLPLLDARYGVTPSWGQHLLAALPPLVLADYGEHAGRRGLVLQAPVTADLVTDLEPRAAAERISAIVRDTISFARKRFGVQVVGLGAFLPALTRFGRDALPSGTEAAFPGRNVPAVTTGHGGTVHLIRRLTLDVLDTVGAVGAGDGPLRIGVIGAAGPIGAAVLATLLAELPDTAFLACDRPARLGRVDRVVRAAGAEDRTRVTADTGEVLRTCRVTVCAITERLEPDELVPGEDLTGRVLIDAGRPGCLDREQWHKRGARLLWPVGTGTPDPGPLHRRDGYRYGPGIGLLNSHDLWACEAEAAVLALSGEHGAALTGPVTPEAAARIGRLCDQAGVRPAEPQSHALPTPLTLPAPAPSRLVLPRPTRERTAPQSSLLVRPRPSGQEGLERMTTLPAIATLGTDQHLDGGQWIAKLGEDRVFMMGDNPTLPVMPDRPTLADFFRLRLSQDRFTALHLIHSARRARDLDLGDAVVTACLLHDIAVGGLLRSHHGHWGAQLVAPYVSEEVAWAIRQHEILRFFPDPAVGYDYPQAYDSFFGSGYRPPEHVHRAYREARAHRWYMTARLITLNDVYTFDFDPAEEIDISEFEDALGRCFRQPRAGLGFDGSPVAHMWRTMIWPNNFL